MSYIAENPDEKKEMISLQVSCYLNLAACYQKTKNWANSFEACNYAISIDATSGRAYFRRAQVKNSIIQKKKIICHDMIFYDKISMNKTLKLWFLFFKSYFILLFFYCFCTKLQNIKISEAIISILPNKNNFR